MDKYSSPPFIETVIDYYWYKRFGIYKKDLIYEFNFSKLKYYDKGKRKSF